MSEIEKAFEAGFRAFREAFDIYDVSDESVEYSLKWRMAEYVAAQLTFAPDVCPVCLGKKLVQTKSRGVIKIIKCASCNGTGQRR